MIRVAIKVCSPEDAVMICELLHSMLRALNALHDIHWHWTKDALRQTLQQNPNYYDLWIFDMKSAENRRLAGALRTVNEKTDFVFICDEDVRKYMLHRPSAFFKDVQDMRDSAGYLYALCERLKKECQQFVLKCGGEFINVPFDKIVMLEKSGRCVALSVANRSEPYLLNDSIEKLILKLPHNGFLHCHQSLIVNLRYVKTLMGKDNPAWPSFILNDGRYVNISRRSFAAAIAAYEAYSAAGRKGAMAAARS